MPARDVVTEEDFAKSGEREGGAGNKKRGREEVSQEEKYQPRAEGDQLVGGDKTGAVGGRENEVDVAIDNEPGENGRREDE